jgi:PhnB protein
LQKAPVSNKQLIEKYGSTLHPERASHGNSMLMLADARPPEWPSQPASFYLYLPDCDAAYARALAAGAQSILEPADQFYGDRHGGVKDAAGNSWWVATHIEDVSEEEMARRSEAWAKQRERPEH